ncbi:MAG: HAD family hydrolase, partial [archaeon]|nr:HAD family hydrolase [archaeon]
QSGKKYIMVDRDDTLCADGPYCSDPKNMHSFPDVPASIKRLNDAGYEVIMITNQSGIGRGYFTLEQLNAVNAELLRQIEAEGGKIKDIFYCPHTPDEKCGCRKPEIGLGLQAIAKYGFDPKESWMIGDKDKDVQFGERLGARAIMVGPEKSFSQAVDEILGTK